MMTFLGMKISLLSVSITTYNIIMISSILRVLSAVGTLLTAFFQAIPIIYKWFAKSQEQKLKEDREKIDRDVAREIEQKRPTGKFP